MANSNEDPNTNSFSKKISWISILKAVLQALLAALAALGLSACV